MSEQAIRALVIPSDTDQPMVVRMIDNSAEGFQEAVGGYFEVISSDAVNAYLPIREGVRTVIVVNEDGRLMEGLEENIRASLFFPRQPLVGTVFICGEQLSGDRDFVSLTDDALEGILHQFKVDREDRV